MKPAERQNKQKMVREKNQEGKIVIKRKTNNEAEEEDGKQKIQKVCNGTQRENTH